MKRIAINGFGRIGRLVLRYLSEVDDVEIVAVNDLADNATLAHLFKYDSAHGIFAGTVDSDSESIVVNGHRISCFEEKDPAALPWKELGVDIVLECTGKFRKREDAERHLHAGAGKVLISAPAKSDDVPTVVLGVNEEILNTDDRIISNASCTTNCLAPVVKILDEHWGIDNGFMNTIHAYTADQRLHDAPHRDLRRARAAAVNIVPTSTGAAKAVGLVLPHMKGKIDAIATRVPVITGSLVDLTVILHKETSEKEINEVFRQYAEGSLKGILQYSDEPLVSSDIVSNRHSSIFDSQMTKVKGNMAKVISWYDNEAGYAARLADLARKV